MHDDQICDGKCLKRLMVLAKHPDQDLRYQVLFCLGCMASSSDDNHTMHLVNGEMFKIIEENLQKATTEDNMLIQ